MKRLNDMSARAARAERMREMRMAGKVPKQIARAMDLHIWTVYRELRLSGTPAAQLPVPDETRAAIARMIAGGASQSSAARAHGVHPSTVCKWLARGAI